MVGLRSGNGKDVREHVDERQHGASVFPSKSVNVYLMSCQNGRKEVDLSISKGEARGAGEKRNIPSGVANEAHRRPSQLQHAVGEDGEGNEAGGGESDVAVLDPDQDGVANDAEDGRGGQRQGSGVRLVGDSAEEDDADAAAHVDDGREELGLHVVVSEALIFC